MGGERGVGGRDLPFLQAREISPALEPISTTVGNRWRAFRACQGNIPSRSWCQLCMNVDKEIDFISVIDTH